MCEIFIEILILSSTQLIHKIFLSDNTVVRKKNGPCAKKVNPCAKKMTPYAKKNEPRNKKLYVKKFIFFVDKLNMVDFNIFKMLKLIFTCESCAISITE